MDIELIIGKTGAPNFTLKNISEDEMILISLALDNLNKGDKMYKMPIRKNLAKMAESLSVAYHRYTQMTTKKNGQTET